jgi:hypothetical protein
VIDDPASTAAGDTGREAIFFDGSSSRRRKVVLTLADQLEIAEAGATRDELKLARWAYADIRRADSPDGMLRLSCNSAAALARLEIRDVMLAADVVARCTHLDEHSISGRGVAKIVGWSLAAAVSIVSVVLFGVPLAADRLAPLVPAPLERRVGDAAELQVKTMFGKGVCDNPAGQAAFIKLMTRLHDVAGLGATAKSTVLPTAVPNAFGCPAARSIY